MRWAEAQASSADQRSLIAAKRVEELINGATLAAISEVTLIEFHTNVCIFRRHNKPGDHDDAWLERVQTEVMRWIANGDLTVLAPTPRMFETAMSYITLAQSKGRSLRAMDAAHLCRATEWARETGQMVTVLTGDPDFGDFLMLFPRFRDFIEIESIGTLDACDR